MKPFSTLSLPILYRDDNLLVINKAAGRVTEGDASSLEVEVQKHFDPRARALHRLDRATSGVLAFSLRRQHHAAFVQLWEQRQIKKFYWAWVEGCWPDSLRRLEGDDADGREMRSQARTMMRQESYTLLELQPLTGRRHQLRIQCAAVGHPIVGDHRYGAKRMSELGEAIALHARALAFVHPLSGERLELSAECPASWSLFPSR
jgi:23S rRNA-/tRNA-specific pseudouridylate synthase